MPVYHSTCSKYFTQTTAFLCWKQINCFTRRWVTLRRVDLPQPLGPRSIHSWPGGTWREQFFKIGTDFPCLLVTEKLTLWASMAGATSAATMSDRHRQYLRGANHHQFKSRITKEENHYRRRWWPWRWFH